MSLKRTPRFRLAPRRAQNGACPGYGAILRGECALCVLNDLFWCPGRFMCIGGRPPAQGAHPSAVEALSVRNADLPGERSLSTTPPQNPMARGRPVRAPSAVGESGWASREARASQICTRGGWKAITRMVAAYHPLPKTTWPAVDRCARRAP